MCSRRSPLPSAGLAIACALTVLSASRVLAQSAPAMYLSSWDTFSADVTVRHRRLRSDGSPNGIDAPPVRYRWERTETAAGWKTVLTFQPPPAAEQRAIATPQDARFEVARVEDDEDGTPARVFNRLGQRMELPGANDGRLSNARHLLPATAALAAADNGQRSTSVSGREWVDSVIADPARTQERRAGLRRQFGRPTGKVRGLNRFVRTEANRTEELLADPTSALPLEMNVVEGGRLVWHGRFAYSGDRGGASTRQAMHVEQIMSEAGERLSTDLELANVRLERRR